jgi:hypothetical protein
MARFSILGCVSCVDRYVPVIHAIHCFSMAPLVEDCVLWAADSLQMASTSSCHTICTRNRLSEVSLQLKEETVSAELRVTTATGLHSAPTVPATGCPHLSHRVQQRAFPIIPSRKDWFEGNTASCPDRSAATDREGKDSKSLENLIE